MLSYGGDHRGLAGAWGAEQQVASLPCLADRGVVVLPLIDTTTETLICPGWETLVVPISQPGTPGRNKRGVLLSRVWQPRQKAPFCPGC